MKRSIIICSLVIASSLFGCKKSEDATLKASEAQQLTVRTSGKRPEIRHENYDGSKDVSGTKMLEPETLNNAITALLGEELSIDLKNPLDRDFGQASSSSEKRYPVYLGSLDYHTVTERTKEVTSTMPLVMDRIAKGICDQAVGDGKLGMDFSAADQEEVAGELHMRLCSRPIDEETYTSVENILQVDANTEGWKAVCIFFLLKQGSLLIN